jgi:hypothetical protein
MRANTFFSIAFVSFALAMRAEEPPARLGAFAPTKTLDWDDPKWWNVMRDKSAAEASPGLKLGKSDYVLKGPLANTFRLVPRSSGERSLARKLLDLPIVNLFVPQPMPMLPHGGKYFAWSESDRPWSMIADRPIPGPQSTLLSISR